MAQKGAEDLGTVRSTRERCEYQVSGAMTLRKNTSDFLDGRRGFYKQPMGTSPGPVSANDVLFLSWAICTCLCQDQPKKATINHIVRSVLHPGGAISYLTGPDRRRLDPD